MPTAFRIDENEYKLLNWSGKPKEHRFPIERDQYVSVWEFEGVWFIDWSHLDVGEVDVVGYCVGPADGEKFLDELNERRARLPLEDNIDPYEDA
jgi:hypothetical protein